MIFPLHRVLSALPDDAERYVEVLDHGNLRAGLYAPRQRDDQAPHREDEVYLVVRGSGTFRQGSASAPFGAGDLIFVPAGEEHRFEEFTDDLVVWAVFTPPAE